MTRDECLAAVTTALVALEITAIAPACQAAVDAGIPPYDVLTHGLAKGMDIVGQKYQAKEYFLSELIMAGECMKEGVQVLTPHLQGRGLARVGRAAVGSVRGDLHDIGKNVFAMLLETAGFEVVDLGVDVPVQRFVEAVRRERVDVLGISALLTVTMPEMARVITALNDAGIRERVKVLIGGAPITAEFAERIGADAYAPNAVDGVKIATSWVT